MGCKDLGCPVSCLSRIHDRFPPLTPVQLPYFVVLRVIRVCTMYYEYRWVSSLGQILDGLGLSGHLSEGASSTFSRLAFDSCRCKCVPSSLCRGRNTERISFRLSLARVVLICPLLPSWCYVIYSTDPGGRFLFDLTRGRFVESSTSYSS